MEVHPLRIEHGAGQNNTMPYSQRQQNHRPNHSQSSHTGPELYKPSRYPVPQFPQLQNAPAPHQSIGQVQVAAAAAAQRYPQGAATAPVLPGGVYRDFRPNNRISLLHPEYNPGRARETLQPGGVVCVDGSASSQPMKKIRLQDKDRIEPLKIDTRDQPGSYTPQVEAISPTLPYISQQEDESFRIIKDELIQQIGKVDREIAKTESQIAILKKKQQDIEEIAIKPSVKSEVEEDTAPKHQSLPQKIYAENRKKAQNAHAKLDPLGPKVEWPLYNQPSDTTVYHENKRKHAAFKHSLLEYFKKRHAEKETRNTYLAETYSKLMQDWMRKVDKIEASTKRKAKEAKNREFFEKVFPELRKQREDKERFNRVGARVKSEADMEEIMDNLQEQAMEDKKMRSYAVIPPILLDSKERKLKYQNNNGFVEDMEVAYKSRQYLNIWTPSEKEVFKEKYLQHPKNFGVVASYLDRKSVSDCVQYYYTSKKTENYKQLLRKNKHRTRSRNNTQKVNSTANTSVVDILTTGVTTRLQREQQQKTVVVQNRETQAEQVTSIAVTNPSTNVTVTSASITNTSSSTSSTVVVSTCVISSSAPVSSSVITTAAPVTEEAKNGELQETKKAFFGDADKPAEAKDAAEDEDCGKGEPAKKKLDRRKEKENAIETSDEEANTAQDKACAVCGTQLGPQLQSRPLQPSQASQYGLREDQLGANARVCNTCRCKSVRSRYTHCPLPSCPNSRGRVKRLRSFPYRLQELPQEVKEPLLAEFRVPSGVTKCCSACFNRIQRRLGPAEEWEEEEVNRLKAALTELGANWQALAERLGKQPSQIRSFYASNRKRLNLESCLGDRKPALTDEEESGSSTSSCEEALASSDTASAAESPPVQPNQNPVKKEDYDSSATETADEQTPEPYQAATITPVNNDGQPRQNSSPLSVKDLVLNMIEFSLMKNPGGQQQQAQNPPTSGMAPTISSILNNDSNEVTIVSEFNLAPRQQNNQQLAQLVNPLIGATITPVPMPPHSESDVVMSDGQPETLDLSIKKPREPSPQVHKVHRQEPAYIFPHRGKNLDVRPVKQKQGSITLGTPIVQQRYDGMIRPEQKMGSITQGTPIHMPQQHLKDRYDYYNKGRVQNQYGYSRQPYPVEQQLTSRQIIMNDYITSQQMLVRRNEKQYFPNSPHRTASPQQQVNQNQQRQGVIQRHTRPYLPPGHEALSSLVDVAVQQPSLPVPTAPHEGLGKTMADNIMEQPQRYHLMQQQQQHQHQVRQQRIDEQRRYQQQQQQQHQRVPRSEPNTLTAASLIDAIITHQINQTAEGGREVVANQREQRAGDLLFQGVYPPQPQEGNGERSPSVISLDVEGDKNLTVKDLTDSVISHDFTRQPYYHMDSVNEQWKRRLVQAKEDKRSATPQADERQIIRIAQPAKYQVEPVSPPESNHWPQEQFRRGYQQPQPHLSALDYVKNRIVEVMRTEDDKKEGQEEGKDRSDSPGEMVIDEEKEFEAPPSVSQGYSYSFSHKEGERSNEPKPLLSAQYEPLSDED